MTWWCSARSTAWTWAWQAYPGVWVLVGLLLAAYLVLERRVGAASPHRRAWFFGGLATLWIALDWPIGALGAGYLASVHMVQYLLIALLAPALLLRGIPEAAWARVRGSNRPNHPKTTGALRLATHPLVTLAVFAVVVHYTHLPSVVDGLMATQWGSFLIDMLWLVGGLLFWWPIVAPVPSRPAFQYPVKMGYLFVATILNTLPYAFLTFGELPFYGIYELAPPFPGVSTRQDQQVAGLLMKVGGGVILWTAITVLFIRWFQRESADEPRGVGRTA